MGVLQIGLCALALAAGGCTAGEAPLPAAAPVTAPALSDTRPIAPVTQFAGELHLHQFPLGGHAWALFTDPAIPLAEIQGDQLLNQDWAPLRREGPCTLYLRPSCTPACDAKSYCYAPNLCAPLRQLRSVDVGQVYVTGSSRVPTIRMWFTSEKSPYDADPQPGKTLLYAGGERLQVVGGVGSPVAFRGSLPAPLPVQVLTPDLTSRLQLPADAPLVVRWEPAGAQLVLLRVYASVNTGPSGYIRCLSPDSGALTVPQSLLAALPPPPRSIRFELERDEERFLNTALSGTGILAHATYTTWKNDTE